MDTKYSKRKCANGQERAYECVDACNFRRENVLKYVKMELKY